MSKSDLSCLEKEAFADMYQAEFSHLLHAHEARNLEGYGQAKHVSGSKDTKMRTKNQDGHDMDLKNDNIILDLLGEGGKKGKTTATVTAMAKTVTVTKSVAAPAALGTAPAQGAGNAYVKG